MEFAASWQLTEITDQRNLATSTDVTSRASFTYDALARVITTTDWLQPQTKLDAFELKYFYADGVDRRTSTEARFAKFNTTTGVQTTNYWSAQKVSGTVLLRITKTSETVPDTFLRPHLFATLLFATLVVKYRPQLGFC